jgi:hypothetical protein
MPVASHARAKGEEMPFIHDETNIEWPEDGSELPPPRADQFVYMTPAEYLGEPASARFSILPISAPAEPEPLLPEEPVRPVQGEPRGMLGRLFGWTRSAGGQSDSERQERQKRWEGSMRQARFLQQQRTQQLFSIMVPALRALGVRRVYCRYDGGNDEGFSRLDHFETQTGEHIDADTLVKQLYDMEIHDKLCAAGFKDHMRGVSTDQKMAEIKTFACVWLISDWACVLLGRGYGTGEYSMYGAFTVDLDECSVTDDPSARPIVENIQVAE